jgi:hypothetical protein
MKVDTRPTLSAPGEWERFYQVGANLDAVLGTPGLSQTAFASIEAAQGAFTQVAERGFFLSAEKPSPRDPLELGAEISGAARSGFMAATSGVRRRKARSTATGTHVDVEQHVRGARVVGGNMRMHQDDRGVFAVTGRPLGDLAERDPGPAPPAATDEALSTCAERFEQDEGLRAAAVEQVVFPTPEGASWAYEVAFVVPEQAADVRVCLSADDFSVLLSYNVSSAATGTARVYPVNPLQTPELTDAQVDDLDDPGSELRGPSVDVSPAVGGRLTRDAGDFGVDPADPAFDEVQAYYHLRRAFGYFLAIVDPALLQARPFTPIHALVNDPQSPDNAYYMPTTGELRFGAFGSRSSARSAAVVCHEFGHAVTDSICRLGRAPKQNTESRGLSEGYSDYFAASWLGDPRLGDYVADDPHGARNCADEGLRFPEAFAGEEHGTGAVWAAVLWGVRGRAGGDTADRLAVESLEFLDFTSTFTDAREALRSVDEQLFAGANRAAIDEEFDARAPG